MFILFNPFKEMIMSCANCGKEVPEGSSVCADSGVSFQMCPPPAVQSRLYNWIIWFSESNLVAIAFGIVSIVATFAFPLSIILDYDKTYFMFLSVLTLKVGPLAGTTGLFFSIRRRYWPGIVLNSVVFVFYAAITMLAIYQLSTD